MREHLMPAAARCHLQSAVTDRPVAGSVFHFDAVGDKKRFVALEFSGRQGAEDQERAWLARFVADGPGDVGRDPQEVARLHRDLFVLDEDRAGPLQTDEDLFLFLMRVEIRVSHAGRHYRKRDSDRLQPEVVGQRLQYSRLIEIVVFQSVIAHGYSPFGSFWESVISMRVNYPAYRKQRIRVWWQEWRRLKDEDRISTEEQALRIDLAVVRVDGDQAADGAL